MTSAAMAEMTAPYVAPLCPAGHLPRKGGDRPSPLLSPIVNAEDWRNHYGHAISPLAGEMSGRTEGGAEEGKPFLREAA